MDSQALLKIIAADAESHSKSPRYLACPSIRSSEHISNENFLVVTYNFLIVKFLQLLTQTPSSNPPGDTVQAASVITPILEAHDITPEIIAPCPTAPNVVCDAQCGGEGKRLVLNVHSECLRCV